MNRFLVAVIDGKKARFLTLEPLKEPGFESGPNLIEQEEMQNSFLEMGTQNLWANAKTGHNGGSGSQGHTYDDHRSKHVVEFERRFAQAITAKIDAFLNSYALNTLVLVAEPKILGLMRDCLHRCNRGIAIHELAKDLCRLDPHELQHYLAHKNLLPVRKRAKVSF